MTHETTSLGESPVTGPEETAASAERKTERTSVGRWLWEWTKSILVAFVLFLLVRTFVVEAFQIPTASMESTLLVGDFLLVNKMAYGAEIPGTELHLPALREPSRGDVVVFEPPPSAQQPPKTNYVKRVLGVPGDRLSMVNGQLIVNGIPLDEPYKNGARGSSDVRSQQFEWQREFLLDPDPSYRPTRDNWGPLLVPPNRFFVMGDNRANSEDSRYWGWVPREAIRGKPLVIYFSYNRRTPAPFAWLTEIRWDRLGNTIH